MILLKCCTQYASKLGKLSSGHKTGRSVFIPVPKKGNAKECSNYCVVALISLASKVMIKLLQARHLEPRISDAQAGLEKVEETKIKLPVSVGSPKNARDFKT